MSLIKTLLKENDDKSCLAEGSFADALRKDLIETFLKSVQDEEVREELSEEPDYDMLLEPDHYDGYEYQTYIQYIDDKTFKMYEGFSSFCWKGFKKQKQYKGMSKRDILESYISNRASKLGTEFGYNLTESDYYTHNSGDYSDVIMELTFTK